MAKPLDYFFHFNSKRFGTNFQEFTRNWDAAFSMATSARDLSKIFCFAAQVVGVGNKKLLFKTDSQQLHARNFMISKTVAWQEKILGCEIEPTAGDVFRAFDAYNLLTTLPSEDFSRFGLKKSKEQMHTLGPNQFIYFSKYLTNLAIYPGDDWIKSWWSEIHQVIGEMEQAQIYHILRAVSIFDCLRPADIKTPSPTEEIGHMILDGIEEITPKGETLTLPSEVYFAAAWFGRDFVKDHRNQMEHNCHSRYERYFHDAVFALKGTESADVVIKGMDHTLDLSFIFHNVAVAFQLDGFSHFIGDDRNGVMHYDGPTRFQSALIKKMMPEDMRVLRLPYSMSRTPLNNSQILQEMLENGSRQPAGVYVAHAANDVRPIEEPNAWSLSLKMA
ncbi:MAG: hypothetical protein AAB276_05090 [Pseudomonadota bacterium]